MLRALGFGGSDAEVVAAAARSAPQLLANVSSASSMWTANAATVSPSADTRDGKVHFTVANLQNKFHRAIEHEQTSRTLRAVFKHDAHFAHHAALPMHPAMGDEARPTTPALPPNMARPGWSFFVYGRQQWGGTQEPQRYPARQTLEASAAVARCMAERRTRGVCAAIAIRDRRGRFPQ